jgi:hypothetical protein
LHFLQQCTIVVNLCQPNQFSRITNLSLTFFNPNNLPVHTAIIIAGDYCYFIIGYFDHDLNINAQFFLFKAEEWKKCKARVLEDSDVMGTLYLWGGHRICHPTNTFLEDNGTISRDNVSRCKCKLLQHPIDSIGLNGM